jgi:hypothetical protein
VDDASAVHGVHGDEDIEREEQGVGVVEGPEGDLEEVEGGAARAVEEDPDGAGRERVEDRGSRLAGQEPDREAQRHEQDRVDGGAAHGGPERRVPAVGGRAGGEAAEGPHEDLVGFASDASAGEAVAVLVEEDENEEGEHERGDEEQPGAVWDDGPDEFGGDEDGEEEVDADEDAPRGVEGEAPAQGVLAAAEDAAGDRPPPPSFVGVAQALSPRLGRHWAGHPPSVPGRVMRLRWRPVSEIRGSRGVRRAGSRRWSSRPGCVRRRSRP